MSNRKRKSYRDRIGDSGDKNTQSQRETGSTRELMFQNKKKNDKSRKSWVEQKKQKEG